MQSNELNSHGVCTLEMERGAGWAKRGSDGRGGKGERAQKRGEERRGGEGRCSEGQTNSERTLPAHRRAGICMANDCGSESDAIGVNREQPQPPTSYEEGGARMRVHCGPYSQWSCCCLLLGHFVSPSSLHSAAIALPRWRRPRTLLPVRIHSACYLHWRPPIALTVPPAGEGGEATGPAADASAPCSSPHCSWREAPSSRRAIGSSH